jgi:hypothetical protein
MGYQGELIDELPLSMLDTEILPESMLGEGATSILGEEGADTSDEIVMDGLPDGTAS